MIKNVERPLHAHHVAQEIAVCKEVTHRRIFIMDRCVGIKHKHHLGPRHLPSAPHAGHDAPALQRVRLVNTHKRRVVEAAEHRQVVVINIVNDGLEERQEHAFGGLA